MRYATPSILLIAPLALAMNAATLLCAEPVSYNREIRPILSNNCFFCHGPDEQKREAGLRLDVRESAVAERSGVRSIVPGDPGASELVRRIVSIDADERMPSVESKKSLTEDEIAVLTRWITEGAVYEKHWAFEPVQRPAIPLLSSDKSVFNGIDSFIAHRLEKAGITASSEAGRPTLIRRLYLDLLGIQPSIAAVNAFVDDSSEDAYGMLVERVLANPHYGERWGRHWLDQGRYADSDGYAPDGNRSMWPYRDWVIEALNRDMPFDQFTVEQLAGDLLEQPTRAQLIATGFHRNTLINTEGGTDPEQFRNEAMIDRTNTTGAVWMGLTLGCAQCHTHKFDPITHHEYYQFFAFFNNSEDKNSRSPMLSLRSNADEVEVKRLRKELESTRSQKGKAARAASKEMEKVIREVERRAPTTMIMREKRERRATHIHIRGDFLRKGENVFPGVPNSLPPMEAKADFRTRLDLAEWLTDPEHPLTARVTANRIWMHHFGAGLVETENDFGLQGTLPTHPELLDWLASEFVRMDWSVKGVHRLIVNSATYRQSSQSRQELTVMDPFNKLLGRQNRPRVEAEVIRDLALSASGLFSRRIGGPSVYPPQPEGIYSFTQNKKTWNESQGSDRYRRGMYTFFYRSAPHPMLSTFDAPNFQAVCTHRERSNTPLQSLQVANDRMFIELARGLGTRMLTECPSIDREACIVHGFRLCLSRQPELEEVRTLAEFFAKQLRSFEADPVAARELAGDENDWPVGIDAATAAAWTALARVLLNLDEFVCRG